MFYCRFKIDITSRDTPVSLNLGPSQASKSSTLPVNSSVTMSNASSSTRPRSIDKPGHVASSNPISSSPSKASAKTFLTRYVCSSLSLIVKESVRLYGCHFVSNCYKICCTNLYVLY